MRAVSVIAVLALLVAASLWYVHAPPRSADAYHERAAKTAETLRSHVQTARLWARTLGRDRALRTSVEVGFTETETDATSTVSSFATYDPPPGTDELRTRVTKLGDEVVSVLGELRIAARRGAWSEVPAKAEPLADLAARLERLAAEARR